MLLSRFALAMCTTFEPKVTSRLMAYITAIAKTATLKEFAKKASSGPG